MLASLAEQIVAGARGSIGYWMLLLAAVLAIPDNI
jgi:hypothetical protein